MVDAPIPKSRLEALTDGIFAVSMTLLVLDLRFPQEGPGTVFDHLARLVGQLDNYAISFAVLAVFWVGHLRMLARMREADVTFLVLNLAFLLFTTFVPPLTTVLGEHPERPRAAVLYGATLLAIIFCEMAMWRRACHRLVQNAPDLDTWHAVRRRFALSIAVVLAGVAAALVEIRIGASAGLAPWVYVLLIGMGLVRPPIRSHQ